MTTIPSTITAQPTIFTPPPHCSSSWTYEPEHYNDFSSGILLQNVYSWVPDLECFPSGFDGAGRAADIQIISPAVCPSGYTTASLSTGTATLATCCQKGYTYSDNSNSKSSFRGCTSTFTGQTTVKARYDTNNLITTALSGTYLQWAQAITVEHRQTELSLFPSSTGTSAGPAPAKDSAMKSKSDSETGLSSATQAAIAIGVVLGLLLLGVIPGILLWRRRRARSRPAQKEVVSLDVEPTLKSSPPDVIQRPMQQHFAYTAELRGESTPVELSSGKERRW